MLSKSPARIRERILSVIERKTLPKYDDFLSLCNDASAFLESESSYRPFNSRGIPSGLLDFSSADFSDIPAFIIPDIHGRASFLLNVLDFAPPNFEGETILSLLEKNKIFLISLGDLPHSEGRARDRWISAYLDFLAVYSSGKNAEVFLESPAMTGEMIEDFAVWETVFHLKIEFPHNFHILKGNHDNVRNANFFPGKNQEFGNRSFGKFCEEGLMCAEFIRNKYDDLFLHCLGCFEHALPICAILQNVVLSHAEPLFAFSHEDMFRSNQDDRLSYALTWTDNGEAEDSSVEKTICDLSKEGFFKSNPKKIKWIGGHRIVHNRYFIRQNGLFVQIHNPNAEQIAFVDSRRPFNPDTDIFVL